MGRRRLYRFVPWAAVALVALALTAGIAWQFLATSLRVDFLRAYVTAALEAPVPGLHVEFGRLEVRWGGWRQGMDIVAADARVVVGDFSAQVPEVVLKLSLRALARRRFLPSELEIVGVAGRLIREQDGQFRLAAVGARSERPIEVGALERLFGDLGAAPDPARPLTYMRHLRLRDATFAIDDRQLDVAWQADGIDVDLHAGMGVVGGVYRATLRLDATPAHIEGSIGFDPAERLLRIDVGFADLPADSLATRIPAVAESVRLRADLSGRVHADLTLAGIVRGFTFDLDAAPGSIAVAHWLNDPEPFASFSMRGRMGGDADHWELDALHLEFGDAVTPGPRFAASASLSKSADSRGLTADVSVADLRLSDFPRFWPEPLEANTRRWILQNITAGAVPEARVRALLALPSAENPAARLDSVDGTLQFDDLRVRWDREAPPVTGLSGRATISRSEIRFQVERGSAGAVTIDQAVVDLTHLDHGPAHLRVDLSGAGPLAAALQAADLRAPSFIRVAVDPRDDRASASFHAAVEFALDGHVAFDDLGLTVDAEIGNAEVDSAIAAGRASARLAFRGEQGRRLITGTVDATHIRSEFPVLGWEKNPDESAEVEFSLVLSERGTERLDHFAVTTDGAAARGSARFAPTTGAVEFIEFTSLRAGRIRTEDARIAWEGADVDIAVLGGVLDLVPAFSRPEAVEKSVDGVLRLTATALDAVHLAEEGWIENVSGAVERAAGGWRRIELEGRIPREFSHEGAAAPRALHIHARPGALDLLDADLSTDDFGGLAAVLGWTRAIHGGKLNVTSRNLAPHLNRGELQVDASGFTVRDAPLAVRLLSLSSLESLLKTMQGEALSFANLTGVVAVDEQLLELSNLRAHGSSLGWTANGTIDRTSGAVDVDGILIPAYAANRILNAVPFVRELLVGEGLFAVDFHIGGSLREPDVDVHPMSALTPELLRRVFGYPEGG